jgi:SagB-type dehydrogenase family enzyme
MEPRPRQQRSSIPRVTWQTRGRIGLPAPTSPPSIGLAEALDFRTSTRVLGRPSFAQVGALLWLAARTKYLGDGWSLRPAPSAGGLHPTELLLFMARGASVIYRYDPDLHALEGLPTPVAKQARFEVLELLPAWKGAAIVLVSDAALTFAKYTNAESLVWRDAGSFLTALHLAAVGVDLAFTQLGILGEVLLPALRMDSERRLLPVGMAAFGTRDPAPAPFPK